MTDRQLIQKRWGEKRVIIIKNDHLNIQKKTLKEDLEYTIKFDELGFEIIKKVDKTGNYLFYIFLVITLAHVYGIIDGFLTGTPLPGLICWGLGILFFGFFCISAFTLRNFETLCLAGGRKSLELIATKPDRQTVANFIEQIHNAIRVFYKEKYMNFDDDTIIEDKLSILKWLNAIQSITDEEFEELSTLHKTQKIIGFKFNDN